MTYSLSTAAYLAACPRLWGADGDSGEFGYVNAVNDFGYSSLPGYIFAAYFGNNAGSLHKAMAKL